MPALVAEQKFERYRINRLIGSGISGETYEAEDTIVLRKVALKLLHPWRVLPDSARRQFFREMQVFSQVYHPYLAPLLDYGEHERKLYVARHYAVIGSLLSSEGRAWFKPPLPINDSLHYAHQLAQALDALHTQGYLHGSLTLSNILIVQGFNSEQGPNFAPFLLSDFGLALFVRRFGQPQNSLSPITAAPEQLGQHATPASDQFALAVLLYFWLSGRMPYFGSTGEIEVQKRAGRIIPLISLNPDITAGQADIIRRALAAHPEERFPSTLAFTQALLATLPAPAVAPEPAPSDVIMPETPQPITTQATSSVENMTPIAADKPFAPPLSQAPQLIITCDGEEQREVFLEASDYTLGRAGSDTIFLEDSSVSRHHALLAYSNGRYCLSDQHSASGIYVNGHKLEDAKRYTPADGDIIKLGKYTVLFRQG